jgi:hypothetical protein
MKFITTAGSQGENWTVILWIQIQSFVTTSMCSVRGNDWVMIMITSMNCELKIVGRGSRRVETWQGNTRVRRLQWTDSSLIWGFVTLTPVKKNVALSISHCRIPLSSHFLTRGKETWVQLRSSGFQCCTGNSNCSRPRYELQQTRNSWDVFCDNSGRICLLECTQKEGKAYMKGNKETEKSGTLCT